MSREKEILLLLLIGGLVALSAYLGNENRKKGQEINRLKGSLEECETQIDSYKEKFTEIKDDFEQIESGISELRSSVDDLEGSITSFSSGEDWAYVVPVVELDVDDVASNLSELETAITSLDQSLFQMDLAIMRY